MSTKTATNPNPSLEIIGLVGSLNLGTVLTYLSYLFKQTLRSSTHLIIWIFVPRAPLLRTLTPHTTYYVYSTLYHIHSSFPTRADPHETKQDCRESWQKTATINLPQQKKNNYSVQRSVVRRKSVTPCTLGQSNVWFIRQPAVIFQISAFLHLSCTSKGLDPLVLLACSERYLIWMAVHRHRVSA